MLSNPETAVDLSQELIRGFASRFIRRKACQLIGRAGIRRSDRDDVEQDLRLHLVKCFPKFDPTVAHWTSFVMAVLDRQVATQLETRRRQKRHADAVFVSLEATICSQGDDGDGDLSQSDLGPLSCQPDTPMEHIDLALDVHSIVARLPRARRGLCRQLMTESVAEIARKTGIPRGTLRCRITALRKDFAGAVGKESRQGLSPSCAQTR